MTLATVTPLQSAAGLRSAAPLRPATAPRVRLRITRRGRAVLTTLVALPVAALVIAVGVIAVNGGAAFAATDDTISTTAQFDYVTVRAGQSLWELAERLAPSADPRDVIGQIVSLNQLDSASIAPGQRLAIPAEHSG